MLASDIAITINGQGVVTDATIVRSVPLLDEPARGDRDLR